MVSLCTRVCIYPLCVALGVVALTMGVIHALLCQPYYFAMPGVVTCITLLVPAFHAMFLAWPHKFVTVWYARVNENYGNI